jgi:hypothetical protein
MLENQKQDTTTQTDDVTNKQVHSVVFIKPIIKRFIAGEQTVYMVISEKGKSLAVFDTIKACKHFAIRNQFEYQYVH